MSAATEQQNNGDVAVEKVAADAIKDDLKSQKDDIEDCKTAAVDNGTALKDEVHEDDASPIKGAKHAKGIKRPSDGFKAFKAKNSDSKKAKKEKATEDSDDEEVLDEEEIIDEEGNDSDIDSDEYDIRYDGEEDDIECEDEDDENDDGGSGSDDQA